VPRHLSGSETVQSKDEWEQSKPAGNSAYAADRFVTVPGKQRHIGGIGYTSRDANEKDRTNDFGQLDLFASKIEIHSWHLMSTRASIHALPTGLPFRRSSSEV